MTWHHFSSLGICLNLPEAWIWQEAWLMKWTVMHHHFHHYQFRSLIQVVFCCLHGLTTCTYIQCEGSQGAVRVASRNRRINETGRNYVALICSHDKYEIYESERTSCIPFYPLSIRVAGPKTHRPNISPVRGRKGGNADDLGGHLSSSCLPYITIYLRN